MTDIPERAHDRVFLFDMDSSLADFEHSLTEKLAKMMSPIEQQGIDWSQFTPDDSTRPDWLKARERAIKKEPGFWSELPTIEFGMQLFELAGTLNYRRMILTKGPRKNSLAWKEKIDWCMTHIPDVEDLAICTDKGLVYGKVLYDDYPPYVMRWLEWRPRGRVLMLDATHNQGFEHPRVFRCYRRPLSEQLEPILEFLGDL
jgi:5'-nucleotidase